MHCKVLFIHFTFQAIIFQIHTYSTFSLVLTLLLGMRQRYLAIARLACEYDILYLGPKEFLLPVHLANQLSHWSGQILLATMLSFGIFSPASALSGLLSSSDLICAHLPDTSTAPHRGLFTGRPD